MITYPYFICGCAVVLFFTSGASIPPLVSHRVVLFESMRPLNDVAVTLSENESKSKALYVKRQTATFKYHSLDIRPGIK